VLDQAGAFIEEARCRKALGHDPETTLAGHEQRRGKMVHIASVPVFPCPSFRP